MFELEDGDVIVPKTRKCVEMCPIQDSLCGGSVPCFQYSVLKIFCLCCFGFGLGNAAWLIGTSYGCLVVYLIC